MRYMGPMFYENWLNDNDLDADGNCISTDIVYAQVLVSISPLIGQQIRWKEPVKASCR